MNEFEIGYKARITDEEIARIKARLDRLETPQETYEEQQEEEYKQ